MFLIGGGDPLLTSEDYPIEDDRLPAFDTTSLDRLADAFVANGVTRITGTVIGDGTRYDDEFSVDSWADGVAGTEAGPYDALLVNDARCSVVQAGSPIRTREQPASSPACSATGGSGSTTGGRAGSPTAMRR